MTDKTIKRLTDSSNLIDVLVQIENFFDSLDLYVFKNWLEGEVVQGPNIQRYWVEIVLRYNYREMPDPQGGLRLLKHNARIRYEMKTETVAEKPKVNTTNADNKEEKLETKEEKYWLVHVRIPRRHIEELYDDDLELYDDDVEDTNIDAASDARDEDIDSSNAFKEENNEENPD
jgi:hypothetical protein